MTKDMPGLTADVIESSKAAIPCPVLRRRPHDQWQAEPPERGFSALCPPCLISPSDLLMPIGPYAGRPLRDLSLMKPDYLLRLAIEGTDDPVMRDLLLYALCACPGRIP